MPRLGLRDAVFMAVDAECLGNNTAVPTIVTMAVTTMTVTTPTVTAMPTVRDYFD